MSLHLSNKYSNLKFGNWNYNDKIKYNQSKYTNKFNPSKFYFNIDLWNKRNPENMIDNKNENRYPNDKYFGEGQYGITYITKNDDNKVVKFLLPENTGHSSFLNIKSIYGNIIHKGFKEQQERDYYENIQWEISPYQNLKGLPFILNIYYPLKSNAKMLKDNNIGYYVMDKLDNTLEQEFLPYNCKSIYEYLKKIENELVMDDIDNVFTVNLKCNKSINIFRCMDILKDYYKDKGKKFNNINEYLKQRMHGSHNIICNLRFKTLNKLIKHIKKCHIITTKIPGYNSIIDLIKIIHSNVVDKSEIDIKNDLIKINDILYLLQRTPYKHYDLKPQNIMKKGNEWMIIDWGMYDVIPIKNNINIWTKVNGTNKWDSRHYKLKQIPNIINKVRNSPIMWKYDIHTLYKLTSLLNSLTNKELNILMKGDKGNKQLIFVKDPINYYNKYKYKEFQIIKCKSNKLNSKKISRKLSSIKKLR